MVLREDREAVDLILQAAKVLEGMYLLVLQAWAYRALEVALLLEAHHLHIHHPLQLPHNLMDREHQELDRVAQQMSQEWLAQ